MLRSKHSSCTLCSRLQTKLEDLAKKNSDSMYLARVDLDKLPELKEEFGITAVPTTQAFYKGEVMGEVKGPKWVSIRELTDQLLAV
jgi:thioredoxin-like negative regulator of GroEL